MILIFNLFPYSFYSRAFEKMFQQCLELPSQSRYSIAFPLLCTHFMSCTHELCPEDKQVLHSGSLWEWKPSDLTFRFYCALFCAA